MFADATWVQKVRSKLPKAWARILGIVMSSGLTETSSLPALAASRQLRKQVDAASQWVDRSFKFGKIPDARHRDFIPHAVPFGPDRVSRAALMHSVLHLFSEQEYFLVRIAGTPGDRTGGGIGDILITLFEPKTIASFMFDLELRSGQSEPRQCLTIAFVSAKIDREASCEICDSYKHLTELCLSFIPIVLETAAGMHLEIRM